MRIMRRAEQQAPVLAPWPRRSRWLANAWLMHVMTVPKVRAHFD